MIKFSIVVYKIAVSSINFSLPSSAVVVHEKRRENLFHFISRKLLSFNEKYPEIDFSFL